MQQKTSIHYIVGRAEREGLSRCCSPYASVQNLLNSCFVKNPFSGLDLFITSHEIRLEKIIPAEAGVCYPTCIAGKSACPPADCGGIYGYANLLDTIQDPKNAEYDEMNEWSGEAFDPQAFDIDKINKALVGVK